MRILGNLFKLTAKCKCDNKITITEFHGNFLQGDKLNFEGGTLISTDFVKGLMLVQCNMCNATLDLHTSVDVSTSMEKIYDTTSMMKCPKCGQERPLTEHDLKSMGGR